MTDLIPGNCARLRLNGRPFRLAGALLLALLVRVGAADSLSGNANARTRRALLVAVSDYAASYPGRKDLRAWPVLHSELDAENMRQVLVTRYGFRDEDVLILHDLKASRAGNSVPGAATRDGIVAAFRSALIDPARPGDVLVFLYSGHGQQVADQDGDEPDGLDEALLPYDFVGARAAENAARLLRDDDLNQLLRELSGRMKGQGSVFCAFDCCHAGTITRGVLPTKGRGWEERLDGPAPASNPAARRIGFVPKVEGWTAFSATQSHEPAFEIEDEAGKPLGGAFSYQLCSALRAAGPGATYRDLLDAVRASVKATRPLQTPGAEGNLDQLLFSGLSRPTPAMPLVRSVREGRVELSFGRLQGVTAGSRYALIPPLADPADPASRRGELSIETVDAYTSRGAFRAIGSGQAAPGDRALLMEQAEPEHPLRVLIEDPALAGALQSRPPTPGDPLVLVTAGQDGPYDVLIGRPERAESPITLLRADGGLLDRIPPGPQAANRVRERLVGYWRWRFLSLLRPSGAGALQVSLRVVPVRAQAEGNAFRVLADLPLPAGGGPVSLKGGDHIQLEVINRSPEAAYVTVVNLQSDGTIFPVYPRPARGAIEENRVRGGGTLRVPTLLEIGPPFGTDVFKVIATREQVDFSPLFTEGGARGAARGELNTLAQKPGPLGPLARLLMSASAAQRSPARVDPDVWGAGSLAVETRPR
jgi:hypothetical protein